MLGTNQYSVIIIKQSQLNVKYNLSVAGKVLKWFRHDGCVNKYVRKETEIKSNLC